MLAYIDLTRQDPKDLVNYWSFNISLFSIFLYEQPGISTYVQIVKD